MATFINQIASSSTAATLVSANPSLVGGNASTLFENAVRSFPHLPIPVHPPRIRRSKKPTVTNVTASPSYQRGNMTRGSLLASARILLGSDTLVGDKFEDNLQIASDEFANVRAVTTPINPSTKDYRKLTEALKVPLQYVPNIDGHGEAGTCRRAWQHRMEDGCRFGRVGMISPSLAEWHKNPSAVAYYYDPNAGVDPARINKPCIMCESSRCKILQQAKDDNRIAFNSLSNAISLFLQYEVDYLWCVNIEPSMHASDILRLMVSAKIENGFSAAHCDWHVLINGESYCDLTKQKTEQIDQLVHATFNGAGAYTVKLGHVKQMFGVTLFAGTTLRRTVLGMAGSSMLMELQVDHGGFATAFVPDKEQYYLIPLPHPSLSRIYIRVEKSGFDRILHTFRTTADRTVMAARIQLRQANVTYSVSGTQLTPRLALSATESELLSLWMVAYSEIFDVVESVGTQARALSEKVTVKDANLVFTSKSLYNAVQDRLLLNAAERNPHFGSQSSVRRWLESCTSSGQFITLDQISSNAYEEIYGYKVSAASILTRFNSLFHKFRKLVTLGSFLTFIKDVSRSTWHYGFEMMDIVVRSFVMIRANCLESVAFALEVAIHFCRALGVEHDRLVQTVKYIDTLHLPAGQIWAGIQAATDLPFQAACIMIVESIVNNFSPDPEVLNQVRKELEAGVLATAPTEDEAARAAAAKNFTDKMEDIPYVRVLTEIKIFLGRFNSRTARLSRLSSLLSAARTTNAKLNVESKKVLDQVLFAAPDLIASAQSGMNTDVIAPTTSCYSTSGSSPQGLPLPLPLVRSVQVNADGTLRTIRFTTTTEAFNARETIDLNYSVRADPNVHIAQARQNRLLTRLPTTDGNLDFSVLHAKMQNDFPEFMVETNEPFLLPELPANARSSYSPDEVGANFLKNIAIKAGQQAQRDQSNTAPFATDDQIRTWVTTRSAESTIAPVTNAIRNSLPRIGNRPVPYVMHIEGLAMGGKSKGVRSWISSEDVVVTPSNQLKDEWIESLGKLDPVQRASVFTQHSALVKDCARFIIVDEAYTFETPHLELLRRYPSAKGFITISDGHQIRDVFSTETGTHNPVATPPVFTAIAPCSFVPFDALVTYLRINNSPIVADMYYAGSSISQGLFYDIESDDIIIPRKGDLVINGTQNGKGFMQALGCTDAITAHESQGSRSEYSYIHSTRGQGVCADFDFFRAPSREAHFGVAITRSRVRTIFIVKDKATARQIPYCDQTQVNGTERLSSDCLMAGTPFDLIDCCTMPDITFERCSDEYVPLTDTPMCSYESKATFGSLIDEESQEAIAKEEITRIDVPITTAAIVNTHAPNKLTITDETHVFNPAHVRFAGVMNMLERQTFPVPILNSHFVKARRIISVIFNKIIDPHMFYKLVEYEKSSIQRQNRSQVLKMAMAQQTSRSDTISYAFPKNELAKKVMSIGGALKTLSVTAMNQTQLIMFGDCCDILTHAWVRSLRPGISSPVGFTRRESAAVTGSYHFSWEIDLEKQDSTHTPVHVAVFVTFIEIVAKRLGLSDLVHEIRKMRVIGDMEGCMKIVMGTGLGSGDGWTLICNKIMAISVIVARYVIPFGVNMEGTGDDITLDRKLQLRPDPLDEDYNPKHIKIDDHRYSGRPSFTSMTLINETVYVAKRLRGVLKMGHSPRTRGQHLAYKTEVKLLRESVASIGLPTLCEVYCQLFGGLPQAIESIYQSCFKVCETPYDELSRELRIADSEEQRCIVHTRAFGCFGYALAACVSDNVMALNALASYSRTCSQSECIEACVANSVKYKVMPGRWSNKKGTQLVSNEYLNMKTSTPVVFIYDDHSVGVTVISQSTVSPDGNVRFKVDLVSEEVEVMQM